MISMYGKLEKSEQGQFNIDGVTVDSILEAYMNQEVSFSVTLTADEEGAAHE